MDTECMCMETGWVCMDTEGTCMDIEWTCTDIVSMHQSMGGGGGVLPESPLSLFLFFFSFLDREM